MARRLALGLALFAGALVIALAVPTILMFRNAQLTQLNLGLERDALVIANELAVLPPAAWAPRITAYQEQTGVRATAVNSAGRIVTDSEGTPVGEQFTRPELSAALAGRLEAGVRFSRTLNTDLRYVAAPIQRGPEVIGAVRLSAPESTINAKVLRLEYSLIGALALTLLAAVLAAWAVARTLARPLEKLTAGARRVGADPAARIGDVGGPPEVRQVAAAMDDTAAELDALLTRSRDVAADASHHLRTPLTAMRLRLEAIADGADPDVAVQAERAMVEVDRLTRRIDQVLAIATAEVSAAPQIVDVGAITERRVLHWQGLAAERDVDLSSTCAAAYVEAPLGEVDRIVDELVANALTYARTTVVVDVRASGHEVVLRVSDDGPGIPLQERESVFERFRRGSTAVPGGTGLGLSLVRQAATKSGGFVEVADAPLGTSMQVTWPTTQQTPTTAEAAPDEHAEPPSHGGLPARHSNGPQSTQRARTSGDRGSTLN